jgi:ABC-type transporter MlaC component
MTSYLTAALLLLASAATGLTPEEVPPDDPRTQIEASYARIQAIAAAAESREILARQVSSTLSPLIDWDAFCTLTLSADVWTTLSVGDRARFKSVYETFIVERYAHRFEPKATFRVEFRGPTLRAPDGRSAVVQTTVFVPRQGSEVGADVDYQFVVSAEGGKPVWRIQDIVTDTVSRAWTYRRTFQRILTDKGFDALIEAIQRNVDKERRQRRDP